MRKQFITCLVTLGLQITFMSFMHGQGFEKWIGGESSDAFQSIAQTADDGFILAGNTSSYGNGGNDVFIVKTNASGTLLWSRVIGGAGDDLAYAVAEESNGNIIIAGQTNSFGSGGYDVYLIKLNAFGKILWTKTFGGSGTDYAKGVLILNGRYYLAGATSSSGAGGSDVYLIKTDTSGNVLLSKTYGYPGDDYANAVTSTSGGNLVMAGRTSNFGVSAPVYVIKAKTDGDTLWTRNFNQNNGSQSSVRANSVTELNDLSYIVTGYGYPYNGGYGNMFHLKIDQAGNKIYSNWSMLLADYGNSVTKTSDGGYVVSTQYCNYGCRIRLIKYTTTGSMVWQHDYLAGNGLNYAEYSNGYSVTETSDKGFAVAGYTNWTSGGTDALIIKTDSVGNSFSYTPPVITASDTLAFCSGDSVILTAPAGYATYQWIRTLGNSMNYLDKTASLKVTTSGSYYCVLSNNQGIYVSGNFSVSVYSNTTPSITITGSLNYCAASGQTLSLSVPAGFSYQWTLNGSVISGATNNSYTPTSAGNVTVQCTNLCGVFTPTPVSVNPSATPVVNPVYCQSGNCDVYACNSNMPVLSVNDVGSGATYDWRLNGSTIQSGTSNVHYPFFGGLYTCIATTACGSDTAVGYTVNVIPQSPFLINPSSPVSGCGLTSVILNSPGSMTGIYQWYYFGTAIPGATSGQHTATQTGDYTVEFEDFFCGLSITDPLTVTLGGVAPFITAAGATQVCSGTVTLNSGITGPGVSYTWYKDFVQISGGTNSSYTAIVTGSYRCYIFNPGCGGGWSNTIEVIIGLPTGTASIGSSGICAGNTTSVSFATARSGYTYQWKLNGTILPGATASTTSVSLAGTYTCDVSNTCGTITTNGVSLTVNTIPPATSTPQGSTALCPLASVVLSANAGAGLTYQWYKNNVSQSGATTQNYTITTAGNYKVKVTSSFGCSAFSVPDIIVTSITMPLATAKALDYPRICSGTTVALKAGTSSNYSYQWKKNGALINGAADSIYQTGSAGTYTVTTSNACGSATSSPITVTQVSSPAPIVTPSGPATFCSGGSVLLQVLATAGAGYEWKRNGNFIPGATSANYTATISGNYKGVKTNSYGCSGSSPVATTVTVNGLPNATITPQGSTTFCLGDSVQLKANYNSNYSYIWKKNNVNISGATTHKYEAKTTGNYKAKVTNSNGCTKISNVISLTVPCKDGYFEKEIIPFEVSPNPSAYNFTVHLNSQSDEPGLFFLYDIEGRLIHEGTIIADGNGYVFGADLRPGIYLLRIKTNEHYYQQRIIKSQ